MAEVKFYPEKRKDENGKIKTVNVPLFLNYSLNGKRLVYYTGLRVDLKHWDAVKMQVKKSVIGSTLANSRIQAMRNLIELELINSAKSQSVVTLNQIKEKLDILSGKKDISKEVEQVKITPSRAMENWLMECKEKEAESSVKNNKTFQKHFENYIQSTYSIFSFEKVDEEFYERFRNYLRNTLGHSLNTEAKSTKLLGRFLRWCEKKGYLDRKSFENFKWVSESAPDVLTLTLDEVELLEKVSLSNSTLDRVRDTFLFQLYCGMRFSDLLSLTKSDVKGDYISYFIQKKTKGRIEHTIGLPEKAKAILEKYKENPGNRALPVMSNQKSNDYLKEVGKLAGINTIVKRKMIYGNKAVIKECPKHELLSTHVARRGFITIAISKNILESKIKSITGHEKNSRAFGRYYEVSAKDKKETVDEIFGER